MSERCADLDPIELGKQARCFSRGRGWPTTCRAATTRRRADEIFAALLDGSLQISIAGRYTLDDVAKAHAALEERRMIGKPILVIGA